MLRNTLYKLNLQWAASGANDGKDATEGKVAVCIVRVDGKASLPNSEVNRICC